MAQISRCSRKCINRAKELVVELSDADISQRQRMCTVFKESEKMNDRYKKVNGRSKADDTFDTVKDNDIIKDIKRKLDISNMTNRCA